MEKGINLYAHDLSPTYHTIKDFVQIKEDTAKMIGTLILGLVLAITLSFFGLSFPAV